MGAAGLTCAGERQRTILFYEPVGKGWWEAWVKAAHPGVDYTFSLDGGQPVPDPRSCWQPEEVYGPSRLLASNFPWTDEGWNAPPLASGILYELHIGTDAGVAQSHSPARFGRPSRSWITWSTWASRTGSSCQWPSCRAVGGGATMAWICSPPLAITERRRQSETVSERLSPHGLAVILDLVSNHFGPDGNYVNQSGPYTTEKYQTPWGHAVNLDGPLSNEVRSFFIANAAMAARLYTR